MDELPDLEPMRRIASEVAAEWELELGEPFALSRYSYVAPAGDGLVLKIAWHGDDESLHEAQSLELWQGNGAVRLLRSADRRWALRTYLFSLAYLALLFVSMPLDRLV